MDGKLTFCIQSSILGQKLCSHIAVWRILSIFKIHVQQYLTPFLHWLLTREIQFFCWIIGINFPLSGRLIHFETFSSYFSFHLITTTTLVTLNLMQPYFLITPIWLWVLLRLRAPSAQLTFFETTLSKLSWRWFAQITCLHTAPPRSGTRIII